MSRFIFQIVAYYSTRNKIYLVDNWHQKYNYVKFRNLKEFTQ